MLAYGDTITGTSFDDRVFGWGGDDAITLGAGQGIMRGGAGADTVGETGRTRSMATAGISGNAGNAG